MTIIRCECGNKDVLEGKIKSGMTADEYLLQKKCTICKRAGLWKKLSDEQSRWD